MADVIAPDRWNAEMKPRRYRETYFIVTSVGQTTITNPTKIERDDEYVVYIVERAEEQVTRYTFRKSAIIMSEYTKVLIPERG